MLEIEVDGLAGVTAEMLQPAMARAPGCNEKRGHEETPWKEPYDVRQPVHEERHFVVVVGESATDEAEEMFVDEVEVPEAVNVADGGVIADGVALVGIAQPAEDMPRSSDGEVEQDAREWLQFTPATPVPSEQQIRNSSGNEEDRGDQTLG